jgi:hypothetical protein
MSHNSVALQLSHRIAPNENFKSKEQISCFESVALLCMDLLRAQHIGRRTSAAQR